MSLKPDEPCAEEMSFKLDDFCTELLAHIYSFLPLSDLMTMWDVTKRCRDVMKIDDRVKDLFIKPKSKDVNAKQKDVNAKRKIAIAKRKELFKNSCVYVTDLDGEDSLNIVKEKDEFDEIETKIITNFIIEGPRIALRFIRIFGESLPHLNVDFNYSDKRVCEGIFKYVKKYLKKLNELSISNLDYDEIRVSGSNKIKKLFITDSLIPADLGCFDVLFPRLTSLYLHGSNTIGNIGNVMRKYPYMETMAFENLTVYTYRILSFLNPKVTIVGLRDNNYVFFTTYNPATKPVF